MLKATFAKIADNARKIAVAVIPAAIALPACVAVLALTAPSARAQLYYCIGPDGKKSYTANPGPESNCQLQPSYKPGAKNPPPPAPTFRAAPAPEAAPSATQSTIFRMRHHGRHAPEAAPSAAQSAQKTKTEKILRAELDPYASDLNGWTHLHWAAALDDGEAIQRLINMEAFLNPVSNDNGHDFSSEGKRRAQLMGLKMGSWRNRGETPLYVAAYFRKSAAASVLIANGADVNATNNVGYVPLHMAVLKDDLGVANRLLQNGADVNAKAQLDQTPLHMAAIVNAREIAELLLQNGADINAKHELGGTPLGVAAFQNARETAELLLQNGANVNAKDSFGKTPLDHAIHKGHTNMQSLLRDYGGRCNTHC